MTHKIREVRVQEYAYYVNNICILCQEYAYYVKYVNKLRLEA